MSKPYKMERDRIAGHVLHELYPAHFDKPSPDRDKAHEIQLYDDTGRYIVQAVVDKDNGVSDEDRGKIADTLSGMIANIGVGARNIGNARKSANAIFNGVTKKQWQELCVSMQEYEFVDASTKGFMHRPRIMPLAAVNTFKAWAKDEGLDLSLPALGAIPKDPNNDDKHQITAFYRAKAQFYLSDERNVQLEKVAHHALFPTEPLSEGWDSRLETNVKSVESKVSNPLRKYPDSPNPELTDNNFYVRSLYDALDPALTAPEKKAYLSLYLLYNLTDPPKAEKGQNKDWEMKQWDEAFHADPSHFRNDLFKALHETDLLFPFLVLAQRKDALVGSYAHRFAENWANENGVNLIETSINHLPLKVEERDGAFYIREVTNAETQAVIDGNTADNAAGVTSRSALNGDGTITPEFHADLVEGIRQTQNMEAIEGEPSRFARAIREKYDIQISQKSLTVDESDISKQIRALRNPATPSDQFAVLFLTYVVGRGTKGYNEKWAQVLGRDIPENPDREDRLNARDVFFANGKTLHTNFNWYDFFDKVHAIGQIGELTRHTNLDFNTLPSELIGSLSSWKKHRKYSPEVETARFAQPDPIKADLDAIGATPEKLGAQKAEYDQQDGTSINAVDPELLAAFDEISTQIQDGSLSAPASMRQLLKIADDYGLEKLPNQLVAGVQLHSAQTLKMPTEQEQNKARDASRTVMINSEHADPNQAAYNLYTGLIHAHKVGVAIGQLPSNSSSNNEKMLRSFRQDAKRFYNGLPITQLHAIYRGLEKTNQLRAFQQGFGEDAQYETILPKEMGAKLLKWQELQAKKLQADANPAQDSKASADGGGEAVLDAFDDIAGATVLRAGEALSDDARDAMRQLGITYNGAAVGGDVDQLIAEKQLYYDMGSVTSLLQGALTRYGISMERHRVSVEAIKESTVRVRKKIRVVDNIDMVKKLKGGNDLKALAFFQHIGINSSESARKYANENTLVGNVIPLDTDIANGKTAYNALINTTSSKRKFFNALGDYNLIAEFYFLAGRPDTLFPENTRDLIAEWCEERGINLQQLLIDHELPGTSKKPVSPNPAKPNEQTPNKPAPKLSKPPKRWKKDLAPAFVGAGGSDKGYVQARRNKIAARDEQDRRDASDPITANDNKPKLKLSEPAADWKKDLSLTFLGAGGGDDGYIEARKHFVAKHRDGYALDDETPLQEPYEAADNSERDIPRVYVPGLLPQGKGDLEAEVPLSGYLSPPTRNSNRNVVLQPEKRELIIEAFKANPNINNETIREYTHPEFDTVEGKYYTVIHAETWDGIWTQCAVSTAKGSGTFYDKLRQIVDPLTGRTRLAISDLREDLFVPRVNYLEEHPDTFKEHANEIANLLPSKMPENTKTHIIWAKRPGRSDQIFNSLAEHIRIYGKGVNKKTGVIKTGALREDPDDEHPSLVFRTRWDIVFSRLKEEKVLGMEHIKTPKELLHWSIEKDGALFDCLREDVQEWLSEPDEEYEPPVTITSADEALEGIEPANDDPLVDLDPNHQYTVSELEALIAQLKPE